LPVFFIVEGPRKGDDGQLSYKLFMILTYEEKSKKNKGIKKICFDNEIHAFLLKFSLFF